MPSHSETRRLPYTAQQMYDLVADVASYPDFLPWTAAARIREVTDKGDHQVMLADLVISFKVFRERFGSRVVLWPDAMKIDTEYLDGPFKHSRMPTGAATFHLPSISNSRTACCKARQACSSTRPCSVSCARSRRAQKTFTADKPAVSRAHHRPNPAQVSV